MDKILSARVDEIVLNKITFLAQKLHVSKKKVIEGAVEVYAQTIGSTDDVFEQTSGAWKRHGSMQKAVSHAKSAFRKSMRRYQ